MKLAIVGAKGQLGQELLEAILCGKTELGNIPDKIVGCETVCIDIDQLDITDEKATYDFISSIKPDIVINCAAYTNVDGCEDNQDLCYQANAIGPKSLAIACAKFHSILLHISTDYVFSGDHTKPFDEDDTPNPISTYGKTKLAGEEFIVENTTRFFIIRTAWLYGRYGKNFVKTIQRVAREKGQLKVVSDQMGAPTNCQDLIHHILQLCVTDQFGIYHSTGCGICSWYDFAKMIVSQSNIDAVVSPCTTSEYPTKAIRPPYSVLGHRKLVETIGDDNREWQDALSAYISHQQEVYNG